MNRVVVIASNTVWSVANFRLKLIERLIAAGNIVHVVAVIDNFPGNSGQLITEAGATLWSVRIGSRGVNPVSDLVLLDQLRKIYKKIKPDIVFHYTPKINIYGGLVCRLLSISYISTINGLGSGLMGRGLLSTAIRYLYKLALNSSSAIVFQNKDDLDYFTIHKIAGSNKFRIINGSGIDTDYFSFSEMHNVPPYNFLFVGRLLRDKGLGEFLNAAREIVAEGYPHVKFSVAGLYDDGNPSCLRKEVIEGYVNSGDIDYLGFSNDIRTLLRESTVVVLPSYREGLSRLLLEAAATGRPLLTTNVPGCRELVIDGRNGFLCDPKSVSSLKAAMLKFLALPLPEIPAMGVRSRDLIEGKYDELTINNQYLMLIQELS